jgi:hypothetical protein
MLAPDGKADGVSGLFDGARVADGIRPWPATRRLPLPELLNLRQEVLGGPTQKSVGSLGSCRRSFATGCTNKRSQDHNQADSRSRDHNTLRIKALEGQTI